MREPSMILNKWDLQMPVRLAMVARELGVRDGDTWSWVLSLDRDAAA